MRETAPTIDTNTQESNGSSADDKIIEPSKTELAHEAIFTKEIVDFSESNEKWQDPAERREYFANLSEDGFVDLTKQIAALIRTGDSNKRYEYDGLSNAMQGTACPPLDKKEDLIKATWVTAKEFLNDELLDDERALDYAMVASSMGFLRTHPFRDSNGRTSRIFAMIIGRGSLRDENVERIMTKHSSATGIHLMSGPELLKISEGTDTSGAVAAYCEYVRNEIDKLRDEHKDSFLLMETEEEFSAEEYGIAATIEKVKQLKESQEEDAMISKLDATLSSLYEIQRNALGVYRSLCLLDGIVNEDKLPISEQLDDTLRQSDQGKRLLEESLLDDMRTVKDEGASFIEQSRLMFEEHYAYIKDKYGKDNT